MTKSSKNRRARAVAAKRALSDPTRPKANKLMGELVKAYKRAGLNMHNVEHQAIALAGTVTAAATVAVQSSQMTAEEFGAYAELQFEHVAEQVSAEEST